MIFPILPTITEIRNWDGSIEQKINRLQESKVWTEYPKRPDIDVNSTAKDIINLAEKMAKYESDLAICRINEKDVNAHNTKVNLLIEQFIKDEIGFEDIPDQYQQRIWEYAWSRSKGYLEMYYSMINLVDIFKP